MDSIGHEIRRMRAAQRATDTQQQANEAAKRKESERLEAISAQRVKGFIEFLERIGAPGNPIYSVDTQDLGYFKTIYSFFSRKTSFEPVSYDQSHHMGLMVAGYKQGFDHTYTPVGRGWLVVEPYYESNHHPHDIPQHSPGILVLNNGAVISIPGAQEHVLKQHHEDLRAPSRSNLTPPADALIVRRYILEEDPTSATKTMFANDQLHQILIRYADAAFESKYPGKDPSEVLASKPQETYVDPKSVPITLNRYDEATGKRTVERYQ